MQIPLVAIHLRVTAGALLPAVLLTLLGVARFGTFSGVVAAALVAVCLLLHELAHVSVALFTGTPVRAIGVSAKGPFIQRGSASSALREVCISAAGPLVNVAFAVLLWGKPGVAHWVAEMNAILAFTNVLPIRGSDGRRVLRTLRAHLLARKPPSTAGAAAETLPTTASK